jgi:hypothetical protein
MKYRISSRICLSALTAIIALSAAVTHAQSPAQAGPGCISVTVDKYHGMDIDNFVLTNNCGQFVTVVFAPGGSTSAVMYPQVLKMSAGASIATGINTTWAYKLWGCLSQGTPVDVSGSAAIYDSSRVVCQ